MKTVTFFLPVTAQQKQVNCLNKCIISSSTGLSGFIISLHPCTAAQLSVQLQCLLWIMTLLWDFSITRKSAAFHLFSSRNLLGFNLTKTEKKEAWKESRSSPVASFSSLTRIIVKTTTEPNKYSALSPNTNRLTANRGCCNLSGKDQPLLHNCGSTSVDLAFHR